MIVIRCLLLKTINFRFKCTGRSNKNRTPKPTLIFQLSFKQKHNLLLFATRKKAINFEYVSWMGLNAVTLLWGALQQSMSCTRFPSWTVSNTEYTPAMKILTNRSLTKPLITGVTNWRLWFDWMVNTMDSCFDSLHCGAKNCTVLFLP